MIKNGGRAVSKAILILLTGYKKYISPFLPPSCRFYPTCSEYAYQAVLKHGLIKGLLLGFVRILKCNPFCQGGYDPVR